jgi:3-hydroxyacyl-CoA dehydrogenase
MMKIPNNSQAEHNVLFWEHVFNVIFVEVEKMLDSKHKILKGLRHKLYYELTDGIKEQINVLENEMNILITLIDTTQRLKNAYVISTAKNASLLIELTCENQDLKNQLKDYDFLCDLLLAKINPCKEGGNDE